MDLEMQSQEMIEAEIRKYSVMVGILLVVVFVVPCITLALVAKCFQKQTSATRKNSMGISASYKMPDDYSENYLQDTESSGFGTFGLIELPLSKLDCIERIVSLKHQLSCIEIWKAYAPPLLFGGSEDCKKLVAVLKPAPIIPNSSGSLSGSVTGKENHANCVKSEVTYMSKVPAHHAILNLLGACSPSSNSANISAMLLEYPVYGTLHAFLVCKRLGRISNNSKNWAGLSYENLEGNLLRALPSENRQFLSPLLDDIKIRGRPFRAPLNEGFSKLDLLLFAVQLVNGMQYLMESGVPHKHLSSENIVISEGFYLKISCLSRDSSFALHKRGTISSQSRRTPTGRNMIKWDAPEIIDGKEYTEKSNVWRFGMIFWEMSSLGDTPFAEVPGKSLVEHMKKGATPHLPEGCFEECYSIMKKCWKIDCESRPTFEDLMRIILAQLQPFESSLYAPDTSSAIVKPGLVRYQKRPSLALLTHQHSSSTFKNGSCSVSPPVSVTNNSSCASDVVLLPDTPSPDLCPVGYLETDV